MYNEIVIWIVNTQHRKTASFLKMTHTLLVTHYIKEQMSLFAYMKTQMYVYYSQKSKFFKNFGLARTEIHIFSSVLWDILYITETPTQQDWNICQNISCQRFLLQLETNWFFHIDSTNFIKMILFRFYRNFMSSKNFFFILDFTFELIICYLYIVLIEPFLDILLFPRFS